MSEQVYPWFDIARRELGVRETPGPEATPRIREYQANSPAPAPQGDETPWCADFAGWCIERAGYRSTRSAAARSYERYGVATRCHRGAIAVLSRGPDPKHGHVGFVVRENATTVWLLGGNQGNAVSIRPYAKHRVIGYRLPPGVEEIGGHHDQAS